MNPEVLSETKSQPKNTFTVPDRLQKLGLLSALDCALHLPLRYEDETQCFPIRTVLSAHGQSLQIEGLVTDCEIHYRPRRQLVVTVDDGSAQIVLRFLNFYPNQLKQLEQKPKIRARGEIRMGFWGAEMVHPTYKVIFAEATPLPQTLTPVYPSSAGISQYVLRSTITAALKTLQLHETLPDAWLKKLALPGFASSIELLHNPPPSEQNACNEKTHPAWQRIKLDELVAQQLSLKLARQARRQRNAPALKNTASILEGLQKNLPFALTQAQQRAFAEIQNDLQQAYPMQRLLQGDVGSGKTVVAALAAAHALDNGYQVSLMAPTEILAQQHLHKIAQWLEPLGVKIAWLVGQLKSKQKKEIQQQINDGIIQLAVGTHALLQDAVQFQNLGLVIVDEQHRFGVAQRLSLRNKGQNITQENQIMVPHQLMMSATPIPRTLAMTYYSDIELSIIDELPPGRTPVLTKLFQQERRAEIIAQANAWLSHGKQAYWVCPLIEESETLQLQTATETYEALQTELPNLKIGLIHGRLKAAEKQMVMDQFSGGEIQLLVATTVIEVGVDVPNASLMIIEHAERFGLSQLHQLRGRIGRGSAQSVCVLLYQTPLSQTARERLRTMRDCQDGFEIARRDLKLRGPGDFLGARQSGQAMLRFADIEQDQYLVEPARLIAEDLLQNHFELAEQHLDRWLSGREDYLRV